MNRISLKPTQLSYPEFFSALALKWILGCLYGYIYLHYYNGDDTWRLFEASIREKNLLMEDPARFFRNEYTPWHSIKIATSSTEALMLYANDLQYALLVKSLAIINLVTRDNYYIDVLIFNVVVFFGQYWIFLMLKNIFPDKRKVIFTCVFFFLPAVFWISGLRIEGLLIFFLGLMLYNFVGPQNTTKKILLTATGFVGVFICRPEVALLCIPAMTAYLLSRNRNALKVFTITYVLAFAAFFLSSLIPGMNIPAKVAEIQHSFLQLQGTRFHLHQLDDTLWSFLWVAPQAIANTFFRPFLWEANGALQLLASVDILLFWILLLFFIFGGGTGRKLHLTHPTLLLLLFFSFSLYMAIGYAVPFPGAIIRYKAIPELLIIVSMSSLFNRTN